MDVHTYLLCFILYILYTHCILNANGNYNIYINRVPLLQIHQQWSLTFLMVLPPQKTLINTFGTRKQLESSLHDLACDLGVKLHQGGGKPRVVLLNGSTSNNYDMFSVLVFQTVAVHYRIFRYPNQCTTSYFCRN